MFEKALKSAMCALVFQNFFQLFPFEGRLEGLKDVRLHFIEGGEMERD